MSVLASANVWKHSKQTLASHLVMMLALADFADDDGRSYPSIAALARKCRTTPRHANRILAALVESGEIQVRLNAGPAGTNRYRILLDGLTPKSPPDPRVTPDVQDTPDATVTLTSRTDTPDAQVLNPLTPRSDEPSLNRQEPSIPPTPPKRGKSTRQPAVGLKTWMEAIKAKGETPIPENDAVFVYADEVGIPRDFLHLAWLEFRHRNSQPNAKRYIDWRATFRNAVRGNWLKLWWVDQADGTYKLTTVGQQAHRAHADRKAA